MGTKPDNITTFYAEGYGKVQLVKKSVAYRFFSGWFWNPLDRMWGQREFWYWRGQLVHEWEGKGPNPDEEWGPFYKGQIVWLNAGIFNKIT